MLIIRFLRSGIKANRPLDFFGMMLKSLAFRVWQTGRSFLRPVGRLSNRLKTRLDTKNYGLNTNFVLKIF